VKWSVDQGFPLRLRQAMGEMSDADLARRAGMTRAVIGQYLKGEKKNPHALIIFAIADALGVSPRWLLLGQEEPAKQDRPTKKRKAKDPSSSPVEPRSS
jgi:transcriptional regulator with XRE-family HTH domain